MVIVGLIFRMDGGLEQINLSRQTLLFHGFLLDCIFPNCTQTSSLLYTLLK